MFRMGYAMTEIRHKLQIQLATVTLAGLTVLCATMPLFRYGFKDDGYVFAIVFGSLALLGTTGLIEQPANKSRLRIFIAMVITVGATTFFAVMTEVDYRSDDEWYTLAIISSTLTCLGFIWLTWRWTFIRVTRSILSAMDEARQSNDKTND